MSGTIVAKIRYENASYHTHSELPRVGTYAPDVSLVNTKLQNVSLANFAGQRKIMFTGVSVDTDVFARSVIRFDEYAAGRDNLAILIVTYDLPFAHSRFQKAHDLQNITGLSAIRHAGFGENYGVRIVDGPLAGMYSPAVVVIDENNSIVHREHIEDITAEPDYKAAFRALGIDIDS